MATTMKAWSYSKYGKTGPDVLEQVEVPIPEPGPGQILVKIHTAGINALQWKIASGAIWPIMKATFPQVPGSDYAGTVVRCGADVTGFEAGARVHGYDMVCAATYAEYSLVMANTAVLMPESMDYATGAGLPIVATTALQALRDLGGMPMTNAKDLRVLIVGASGGVGTVAVQLAKAAGATVVGVCGGRNVELVKSLGADEVIDYSKPDA